jgi:hypothetical protein
MTTKIPDQPDVVDALARYGIVRVPVDHFLYGDYRYTRLEDAIAEAKRHPAPGLVHVRA